MKACFVYLFYIQKFHTDIILVAWCSATEEWRSMGKMRSERHFRGNPRPAQRKNADKIEAGDNGIGDTRQLVTVDKVEADDKSKPGIFHIAFWSTYIPEIFC